ncbi:MAG: hypothetical protein AAF485_10700, partial [Chloroflexota bacterium]
TKSISKKEVQQTYRFKVALFYRKGLWRRIEVQGGQTLGEFDQILREAFAHDWDHMSGFWNLIRRGNSRRFREVDLGSINPFGEGDAADVVIAGLGLEPGNELKYVYDFGDWVEHRITLEEIVESTPTVTYPRITAQNKPRYHYCPYCKEKGKKTKAIYVCIECSNREETDIVACEDCTDKYHEDHYNEEILY